MYAVGVPVLCVLRGLPARKEQQKERQGLPSPRERGRGRAKARTNTARKFTHRCCVLRVADRAKQTRSRAKSRSRRRSKARSTSTEEQRTKQHDIIEARQRSKAHTARRRSKALRRLSLAARRHRRLHCKALAHTYVCVFFANMPRYISKFHHFSILLLIPISTSLRSSYNFRLCPIII